MINRYFKWIGNVDSDEFINMIAFDSDGYGISYIQYNGNKLEESKDNPWFIEVVEDCDLFWQEITEEEYFLEAV